MNEEQILKLKEQNESAVKDVKSKIDQTAEKAIALDVEVKNVKESLSAVNGKLSDVETQVKDTSKIDGLKNDMQKQFDSLAVEIKKSKPSQTMKKGLNKLIEEALTGEYAEAYDRYKSNRTPFSIKLNTKTVGNESIAANFTGDLAATGINPYIHPLGVIGKNIRDYVPTGSINGALVYMQETASEGAIAAKVENNATAQIDFDIKEVTVGGTTLTGVLNVSNEMLQDVKGFSDFLSARLPKKMRSAENNALLYGTGSSPYTFTGLHTAGTAFAAGSFATAVDNPQVGDVIAIAINQLNVLNNDEFSAGLVIIHPTQITAAKVAKSGDGNWMDGHNQFMWNERIQMYTINGVPVLESSSINADHFVVLDNELSAQVWDVQAMEIKINPYEDMAKNMTNVYVIERVILAIYRSTGVVSGVVSTALAAIEKAS